jgi:hypothetical protein
MGESALRGQGMQICRHSPQTCAKASDAVKYEQKISLYNVSCPDMPRVTRRNPTTTTNKLMMIDVVCVMRWMWVESHQFAVVVLLVARA